MSRELITATTKALIANHGRRIKGHVYLCRGDGSGLFVADQASRLCYYWIPNASGGVQSVGLAVLDPESNIPFVNDVSYERRLANLGYKEGDDQTEYILGENTAGVQASGGVTIVETVINNLQQPSQAQIGEFLVTPLSTLTTEVYVQPGVYLKASDNTKQYWPGDRTSDLTAAIGSIGAGSHQIAWICLDTNGGTLFSQFGSIVAATNTLPAPFEFAPSDILGISINSTYKPDVPVYLYNGQTGIVEANILRNYDQRLTFAPGATSPGNVTGPSPSTLRALATYADTSGKILLNNPNTNVDASGNLQANAWRLPAATTLTVSASAVTITQGYHLIESSSGTTDNLATINGGVAQQILVIQADADDTITVKNGTGNIFLNSGADQAISGHKTLMLFFDGTNWEDIDVAAASGANTALSNLASTAVNADIIPTADVTQNLGSSAKRWLNGWFQNLLADNNAFPVKNITVSVANAGDVGYVQYDATNGFSYTTTTTANLDGVQWCVVVSGGASNATIYVATKGKVTVKLNANCSIGNFLTTSTTAAQAAVNTKMRAEVFAVALSANSGGAGGTCTAQLYCQSSGLIPLTNANDIYTHLGISTQAFVSTINGAPTATSVVYGAVSSGAANVLVPAAAGQLGLARLWNTTRNSFRLITAVNTGTSTITTVSSTDTWANGDAITIESQTTTTGSAFKATEIDLNNSNNTVIPIMARSLVVLIELSDSAAGNFASIHPFEAFALSKLMSQLSQGTNLFIENTPPVKLIGQVFCITSQFGGVGTGNAYYKIAGYIEARP